MTVAVVTVLALAALAYVCVPLLKRDTDTPTGHNERLDAEDRKRRSLEAILDLENDLEAGKITSDEHQVLRAEHERDAVDAMRELDVLEMSASDTAIEQAIAAERKRMTCPSCGALKIDEERCPSCGS